MRPTTPSGTRTRSIAMPFGRIRRSITAPTGSSSPATASRPAAMPSTRLGSSLSRSSSAAVRPLSWPAAMSRALASRIAASLARMATAARSSAAALVAVGVAARITAAARARCPISVGSGRRRCRRRERWRGRSSRLFRQAGGARITPLRVAPPDGGGEEVTRRHGESGNDRRGPENGHFLTAGYTLS